MCATADDEPRCPRCLWPANSGRYLATGEYTSSSPRSTNTRAASAVIVLVTDQVVVMVSRAHGVLRPGVSPAAPQIH
jgi:hypothetical protein